MGETFIQMVKRYFPDVDDDQADTLLWHCTAFPAASADHIERQIKEYAEKSGADWRLAMDLAHEDLKEETRGLSERT